ncbi:hypothetical protein EYF80_055657 [Liparis tanakae]|uniref:Uncharacterized protein n=1 Tax=Liparis tanakae TaxID=230148 RepID=A0A4Z2F122_9TELE|nr:hypothetical protein EYF80_055657 [Liparis tanakae]
MYPSGLGSRRIPRLPRHARGSTEVTKEHICTRITIFPLECESRGGLGYYRLSPPIPNISKPLSFLWGAVRRLLRASGPERSWQVRGGRCPAELIPERFLVGPRVEES